MLATDLRLGGAEVIVLEELAAPTTESRASTVHARTMEVFEQRGLLPALGDPPRDPAGHYGGLPLDFSASPPAFPRLCKEAQAPVHPLREQRVHTPSRELR